MGEKQIIVRDLETNTIESDKRFDPNNYAKGLIMKQSRRRAEIEKKVLGKSLGGKAMYFTNFLEGTDRLSGAECRVLLHLLRNIEFENWLYVSKSRVAEAMTPKMSRKTVVLAFQTLLKREYIHCIKKDGECYYRLNPEVAWKGSHDEQMETLRNGWKTAKKPKPKLEVVRLPVQGSCQQQPGAAL